MEWGKNANYHNNPCKGCTERELKKTENGYISCKSYCTKWAEWKAQESKRKDKVVKQREISIALYEMGEHRVSTRLRKA